MIIDDMMLDLGAKHIVSCQTIEAATEAARVAGLDRAILDVQVRGRACVEVAEILRSPGIPLVFFTGEEFAWLKAGPFADAPIVGKPFRDVTFRAGIDMAISSRVSSGTGAAA